jgi:hypothetical protein
MGGGGGPSAPPPPSDEEKALQRKQAESLDQQNALLKQQMQTQQLLAPYIYKQAGIRPQMDASGNITGFEEIPEAADPNAPIRQDIETQLLKRSQAALSGQLPVDPYLTRSLGDEETSLRNRLSAQLGPGYETSTPGSRALADFSQRRSELLSSAGRGDLTLAEQLSQARGGTNMDIQNNLLSRALIPGGQMGTMGQLFGQNASAFGAAARPMQQDRMATLQAMMSSAANSQAGMNSLIGGGAGIAAMSAAAFI